jgi:hypothetical protein
MPVSETPRTARTHLEAEVRMVVRTLRTYGALPERALRRLVHEDEWREGTLGLALADAVERGLVRHVGGGFYAPAEPGRATPK